MRIIYLFSSFLFIFFSCSKSNTDQPATGSSFQIASIEINKQTLSTEFRNSPVLPEFTVKFPNAISPSSYQNNIQLQNKDFQNIPLTVSFSADAKTATIKPSSPLSYLSKYTLLFKSGLEDVNGNKLSPEKSIAVYTTIDSTDKFSRISTDELLTLVQKQTFKYFWDFGHPSSGMARERNSSGDVVTSGGTGFGVMAILVAIERGFITKEEGKARIQKIVNFLKTADKFHGAFSHWYNGNTGRTQKFSDVDDGADLVETSLLLQGLLTARQYFQTAADESLRNDILKLYTDVEWTFFQNGQQVFFWHWSPNNQFQINLKIQGWNESLIVYVLAASSPTHPIAKTVYDQGWANNGAMKNGTTNYNLVLPLGPQMGGPLFISQYSFLGINPIGLKDAYADYELQTKNHSLTNRAYSIANPKNFFGYSADVWGLTASDDINGYKVHSPTDDNSVITPTAALTSFAFTPAESQKALEFFYYKLGDKIWGEYGFYDAFSLHEQWFADSYIAIDQGPIIIGIENHRSKLLWNLFMQIPELKTGLKNLNFESPNL
ncbi:glucoamylase family protein [Sphingobacterium hungaricum]|uniref:Beta-glucosidase n=1 Tax=Sphingobacterium hungaricum TaxID=2082723 RepID=A0A928UXH2_9SPHI|nr:glucoamylase family protein [Sphingobacterium hungaricum]MBE8715081.1 beta-glucosidase [Sphingobacterium hungaricum]